MEPVLSFDLQVSAQRGGTLTRDLQQQLRGAILDGRLKPGTALPATRRMADALGIARNTVIGAYDLLVAEGYLSARRGATPTVSMNVSRRLETRRERRRRLDRIHLNSAWREGSSPHTQPTGLPERCFRIGIPEHRYFPHEVWRRLATRSLRAWSKLPFHYHPSEGLPVLRKAIADHVAFARAVVCEADDVLVTSGAQQAFDLLARALVTAGETRVAVEQPCHTSMRASLEAAGARVISIPVDDEGLRIDLLPQDVRIVSVTPSHQSPTGVPMSLARRTALLEFAQRNDAVVIEDDYDGEFRFGGRPLDALQTLDREGRVFYVGTFSKILSPSLRKGFIVAPQWARPTILRIKECADSHCDFTAQHTLALFIAEGHLVRYVRRMMPLYAARREALLHGIRRHLSEWLEPIPAEAGLHLTARIRRPSLVKTIQRAAEQFTPGAQIVVCQVSASSTKPAISFGYGVIDADAIKPALARLAQHLREM
jgi:GntR family transcriptional regulator / MocR family aminotransferase